MSSNNAKQGDEKKLQSFSSDEPIENDLASRISQLEKKIDQLIVSQTTTNNKISLSFQTNDEISFKKLSDALPSLQESLQELSAKISNTGDTLNFNTLLPIVIKLRADLEKFPIQEYYKSTCMELINVLRVYLQKMDLLFWSQSLMLLELREQLSEVLNHPLSLIRVRMWFIVDEEGSSLEYKHNLLLIDYSSRKLRQYDFGGIKYLLLTIQEFLWFENGGNSKLKVYSKPFNLLDKNSPFELRNNEYRKYSVDEYGRLKDKLNHEGMERDHIPSKEYLNQFLTALNKYKHSHSTWKFQELKAFAIIIKTEQHSRSSFTYGKKKEHINNNYRVEVSEPESEAESESDSNASKEPVYSWKHPIEAAAIDILHFLEEELAQASITKDEKITMLGAYYYLFQRTVDRFGDNLYPELCLHYDEEINFKTIADVFHDLIRTYLVEHLK